MKEWRGDGWWEWWVDGTNGGSATRRTGTGWVRIGEISAWLTERSRELLIPETSGSIVEGTICYSGPVTTNTLPVTVLDLAQSISVFHGTDWLNHWMSLLGHLTNRRWNYNARINKWYSLYNKKTTVCNSYMLLSRYEFLYSSLVIKLQSLRCPWCSCSCLKAELLTRAYRH